MKNWRTTLLGVLAGGSMIYGAWKSGNLDAAHITAAVSLILGGASAQDSAATPKR